MTAADLHTAAAGTRATARFVRVSAFKVRPVLDLIRGQDVQRADEILQFSERGPAEVVRKVLRSAVANAENNDAQDPETLYVSACFADEAKTLRRFRPRARGRATRIRKRTSHVTVIVSRMSDQDLERRREREAARPGSRAARRAGQEAAEERRRRRRRAEAEAAEDEGIVDQQAEAAEDEAAEAAAEAPEAAADEIVDQQAEAVAAAEAAGDEAAEQETAEEEVTGDEAADEETSPEEDEK